MEAANKQKHAKYADLVKGWKATTFPVKVGRRGFIGSSTVYQFEKPLKNWQRGGAFGCG